MNISLVKQAKIRDRIMNQVPEIIEARKLKKEIAKILVNSAINSLSVHEKYMYENYPDLMISHAGVGHLYIDGTGFCDNPITKHSYWSWTREYSEKDVFDEVYFGKYNRNKDLYEYFDKLFKGCPELFNGNCSNILDLVDEETKQLLKDLVTKFINCLREAEKKMSKVNKILTSKEIGLNDIKKYSPKLYNQIKLEL